MTDHQQHETFGRGGAGNIHDCPPGHHQLDPEAHSATYGREVFAAATEEHVEHATSVGRGGAGNIQNLEPTSGDHTVETKEIKATVQHLEGVNEGHQVSTGRGGAGNIHPHLDESQSPEEASCVPELLAKIHLPHPHLHWPHHTEPVQRTEQAQPHA